jgi:hypothetical protein
MTMRDDGKIIRVPTHSFPIYGQIFFLPANLLMLAKGISAHTKGAFKTAGLPFSGSIRYYAASLFLPFARLLLSTALPPLVAMRTRKPCVLFLFVFDLFVKFFFIKRLPSEFRGWF